MPVSTFVPDLARALSGVFRLQPDAFVSAASLSNEAIALGLAVVFLAGFSEAIAQSIVLFANRVKTARFFFSWAIDALLFAFGYAFLVASTWVVCRLLHAPNLPISELAIVFALSYAPLLFSFLGALPYLGPGVLAILRVWHFLAMVVGLSAVERVSFVAAAGYVGLGWIVMILAQQTFGKPIAELGVRLVDAVAGVQLVSDEDVVIGKAMQGTSSQPAALARVTVGNMAPVHPNALKAGLGLAAVAVLALLVALTLEPVRGAMFGWENSLPRVARIPVDLLWLGILALVISGFMAPLETLGWWAGWYGDRIDVTPDASPADDGDAAKSVSRFVVYLDGVAQSSSRYTPDIETFLDALAPELPPGVRLIRGVMSYSVMNRPLEDDPLFSAFWAFIDKIRFSRTTSLLGMIVNIRNMLIVAVSADPRYGPMYNFGIAQVIVKSLVANGYRAHSGVPVTLIGYSGGGQMACGSARFVKHAIDAPIDVISLGGVISGNDPILDLEHLHHLVGDKDRVERIGPCMFASRWKVAVLSNWNRARRLGRLTQTSLGPVSHQVPGGMLDPAARLPSGQTNLRHTLDVIEAILSARFDVADPGLRKKTSDYERYVALSWNRPEYYPLATKPPPAFRPVADWIGRLILPERDRRFGGAFMEIAHAPDAYAHLIGATVKLKWNEAAPKVKEMLRAVRRDVSFGAEAYYTSTYGGLVQPVRLNWWRLVDPLESLAAAHPVDDVVVKLGGNVAVHDGSGSTVLTIDRAPVQVTGRYYGLVRFLAAASGDAISVVHFNPASQEFDGAQSAVRMPAALDRAAPAFDGRAWYVYGAPDSTGTFVVQSLARSDVLTPPADQMWKTGDRALAVQTGGGFFGHFAYGIAEVVRDPISEQPRFEITYHHLYAHNSEGLVAGAVDWTRAMGDRQFGWAGRRPVAETIVRDDAFETTLDALAMQLEAMAARYRIGDGTGGTYAGVVHNSTQDSNRALLAAVHRRSLGQKGQRLRRSLGSRLQPFAVGSGSNNEFSLGLTFEDAPVRNVVAALGNWRCLMPRLARDTVIGTLARDGGAVTTRSF